MTIGIKRNGDWKILQARLQQLPTRVRAAQHFAVLQEAHLFRAKVLRAFKTRGRSNGSAWEPLKKATTAGKQSSAPLVDRGDLRNSIVVVSRGRGRVFVGVSSKKRNKSGDRLVDIARVHEHGLVIAMRVTKKMHAYVMAKLSELGGGGSGGTGNFRPGAIIIIKIPERSFLRSTAEAHFKPAQMAARMQRRMARHLGLRGTSEAKAFMRAYNIRVKTKPKDSD